MRSRMYAHAAKLSNAVRLDGRGNVTAVKETAACLCVGDVYCCEISVWFSISILPKHIRRNSKQRERIRVFVNK